MCTIVCKVKPLLFDPIGSFEIAIIYPKSTTLNLAGLVKSAVIGQAVKSLAATLKLEPAKIETGRYLPCITKAGTKGRSVQFEFKLTLVHRVSASEY